MLQAAQRSLVMNGEPVSLPIEAFDARRQLGYNMTGETTYFVHPSAYVDEPCAIGDGTKIWHFCHVYVSREDWQTFHLGQNVFVARTS